MFDAMRPGSMNAAQVKVLVRWLQVSGRTMDEVRKVLNVPVRYSYPALFKVWVAREKQLVLFPEGVVLLSGLAGLAATWPDFRPYFLDISQKSSEYRSSKSISSDSALGLPRFVTICMEPLCAISSTLSLADLNSILPWLLSARVCSEQSCGGIVAELLSRLLDGRACTYEEVVALIPLLLVPPISTNAALGRSVLGRIEGMLDHCSFSAEQLPQIMDALVPVLDGQVELSEAVHFARDVEWIAWVHRPAYRPDGSREPLVRRALQKLGEDLRQPIKARGTRVALGDAGKGGSERRKVLGPQRPRCACEVLGAGTKKACIMRVRLRSERQALRRPGRRCPHSAVLAEARRNADLIWI